MAIHLYLAKAADWALATGKRKTVRFAVCGSSGQKEGLLADDMKQDVNDNGRGK